MQTDASLQGWGASITADDPDTTQASQTGGRWPASDKDRHINVLELLAVFNALKALCVNVRNSHIHVQVDNTTAVAYISAMGGTHSKACDHVARAIWHWCIEREIWLSASHIAGVDNTTADSLSRQFNDRTEWHLVKWAFLSCTERWGTPQIDMFASQLNTQLKTFVAWRPDPQATHIDAFTLPWNNLFIYCFPPFCLIARVLCKIQLEKPRVILIAPRWPTQPWYPVLQRTLQVPVITFPPRPDLITLPGCPEAQHPMRRHLRLQAHLL